MRLFLLTITVFLAFGAGLAGCRTSLPNGRVAGNTFPTLDAASSSVMGLSTDEVSRAVRLGDAKCVRCHKFYDPTAYTDVEWQTWMNKMSKKAHLADDQRELLARYFAVIRASARDNASKVDGTFNH